MRRPVKITRAMIKQVEKEAKKYFTKASGCHDWTHVQRVRNLALRIGRKERADLGILELAALLHDICKSQELRCRGNFCHAQKGASLAKKVLEKYGMDKNIRDRVTHCIISHRYRNNHSPETIEAKILSDSDKLDAIGAVGLARDFVAAGFIGTPVLYTGNEGKLVKSGKQYSYSDADTAFLEYEIKLKCFKDKMYTKEGKRMANERHKYMEDFFKRFWQEVRAEK